MKIRSGFVSNSSSSSFILDGKNNTVRDIALLMIPIREWDGDQELMERVRNLTCDPDLPIQFSTCNYDTLISKRDGYIFVATCHNHEFREVLDEKRVRPPDEIMKKLFHDRSDDCSSELYYALEDFDSYNTIDQLEKISPYTRKSLNLLIDELLGAKKSQLETIEDRLHEAAIEIFIKDLNRSKYCQIRYALMDYYENGKIAL